MELLEDPRREPSQYCGNLIDAELKVRTILATDNSPRLDSNE